MKLYDTFLQEKKEFKPLNYEQITMYICGPTVYDRPHIGNARPIIVFDILYRLLRHKYGVNKVKYVRNITDIDDKIIDRAFINNESISSLTQRTINLFHNDISKLNVLPPNIEPLATDHIKEMINLIQLLIEKDYAYISKNHVLFNIKTFLKYGELSNRNIKELIAGSRIDIPSYKANAGDFILWKPSNKNEIGWDSPWGKGRPGWHIECSAMISKHLGKRIDIHGGGQDLIFPHHENEHTQSTCAYNTKKLANFWLHNGFVLINGHKMSKSLNNFLTIDQVLKLVNNKGEIIKFFMLNTHYRKPLNWTNKGLKQAQNNVDYIYNALLKAKQNKFEQYKIQKVSKLFLEFLFDDLNTVGAINYLHNIAKEINLSDDELFINNKANELINNAKLLGLFQNNPEEWFQQTLLDKDKIQFLIDKRNKARKIKDFITADKIRNKLLLKGIILEDNFDGTTKWISKENFE